MSKTPMISVITPSFNCGAYIRECIDSVLAQNYENFEHIIIDGGSKDETVEILKQYPHLRWISEPDKGEAEALNKALQMVRGDITGWLNADDFYLEGVFHRIAQELDPQHGRHVVYGRTNMIDEEGQLLWEKRSTPLVTLPFLLRWWDASRHPHQPSIFYSKELITDIGPFNPELCSSIDYDYWLRIILKYQFHYVDQTFASARFRTNSKSYTNSYPAQIQSHRKVSLPYHRYLKPRERVEFWKDYCIDNCIDYCIDYKLPVMIAPLRARLKLRTRFRALRRMMVKMLEAR
jgi:glycosyltransferase involved in cell wall biosynthesis